MFFEKNGKASLSRNVHIQNWRITFMKKFFALFLSLSLILSCTPMYAMAAEESNAPTEQIAQESTIDSTASPTSTNNYDYWNTYGRKTIKDEVVGLYPVNNDPIKLHFYLYSGSIMIRVQMNTGTPKTVATWDTPGHHWVDLIPTPIGARYRITFSGEAEVDGGIYGEPRS